MKKIYLVLLSGLFVNHAATAQTLTQAFNQPIIGDANSFKGYDSIGVVPKTAGSGVTWNFTGYSLNSNTLASTFQSTTAVAAAANYPGATIAENQGGGNYNYYKASGSSYELLGSSTPPGQGDFVYSNSAIIANWPVAMGYSVTDTYSGTLSNGLGGTITGTITTEGIGTGTLITPQGATLSNVLLVRTKNEVVVNVTVPLTATLNVTGFDYNYYHGSQKFPIITVSYQASSGFQTSTSANIYLNDNAFITGLNDNNFDATFQVFPNPAKDAFNVSLSNPSNEKGIIELFSSTGVLVKTVELGNCTLLEQNVSLDGLSAGIYIVKTTLGSKTSARKLVIE
jgi:hypothetical protein